MPLYGLPPSPWTCPVYMMIHLAYHCAMRACSGTACHMCLRIFAKCALRMATAHGHMMQAAWPTGCALCLRCKAAHSTNLKQVRFMGPRMLRRSWLTRKWTACSQAERLSLIRVVSRRPFVCKHATFNAVHTSIPAIGSSLLLFQVIPS